MDGFGKVARLLQVRLRRLAPYHVGIGRVSESAGNRSLHAAAEMEEALFRSPTREEGLIAGIDVTE